MDHPDLRPGLKKLVQGPASTKTKGTKPHGTKVLEAGEDTTWTDEATGGVVSIRTIPTLVERLTEDLAQGVATASRMNTVSTGWPDDIGALSAATEQGYPDGALWTTVELVDGALVEIARFQVVNGTWEPVGLDASRLVTGSIDAGLIDTVSLAAHLVSAGLIRTGATGQRLEMTSDGLVLWLVDDDGVEYEAVHIGPEGATLVRVGQTTIAPDAVVAQRGSFSDLAINGRPAAEYVDRRIAAQASRMVSLGGGGGEGVGIELDANVLTGIFDLVVPAIRKDRWYEARIELVSYPRGQNAELVVQLRHSRVDQGVMVNSPLVRSQRRIGAVSNVIWDQKHVSCWLHGSDLTEVAEGGDARLLLAVYSNARVQINGSTTMAVYDTGADIPISSTLNRGGAPQQGSTTATAQVASSQVRPYSQEWSATGTTTWYDSDNKVDSYTGSKAVVQGSYDGTAGRRRHGAWWFPDMTGTLSGATITDVQIWVDNLSVFKPSNGGTGRFWAHNGTNNAVAYLTEAHFAAGQDLWIRVPSQYWDGFKNGSYKGFMALVTTNDPSSYMRFAAGPGSAKIAVKYTK